MASWLGSSWAVTPTWYLGGAGANTTNRGDDPAKPITAAELRERIDTRTLQQTTTVRVMGDLNERLPLRVELNNPAQRFILMGDPSAWTTIAIGSFTSVLAINRTANPPNAQQVTDTALAGGWSQYVGMRVRNTTAGPRLGSTAFVTRNLEIADVASGYPGLGVKTARTTPFVLFDPTTATGGVVTPVAPVPGDTYVVERLPGLAMLDLEVRRFGNNPVSAKCFVDSLEIGKNQTSPADNSYAIQRTMLGTGGFSWLTRCRSLATTNGGNDFGTFAQGCLFANSLVWYGGAIYSSGVIPGTSPLSFVMPENCNLRNDTVIDGVILTGYVRTDLGGFSIWNKSGTAIEADGNLVQFFAPCYGAYFGDDGMQVDPGTLVIYMAGSAPNLRAQPVDSTFSPGHSHDFEIGPYSTPYSVDDLINAPNGTIFDAAHGCGILLRGTD